MRLLLDTHVLIWSLGAPHRLTMRIRRDLQSASNRIYYSAASLFEIASKRAAARRGGPDIPAGQVRTLAETAGYEIVDVAAEHAIAIETIAVFHGDPVDRLLLATAQIENLRLVTHDERLAAYDRSIILF